jgi:hypothetical protein
MWSGWHGLTRARYHIDIRPRSSINDQASETRSQWAQSASPIYDASMNPCGCTATGPHCSPYKLPYWSPFRYRLFQPRRWYLGILNGSPCLCPCSQQLWHWQCNFSSAVGRIHGPTHGIFSWGLFRSSSTLLYQCKCLEYHM